MANKIIPLIKSQNQSFTITLPVNGQNMTLTLGFTYNTQGEYWFMSVRDRTGALLLDAVPIVTGEYPATDILGQHDYMNIGTAIVLPDNNLQIGIPAFDDLGVNYYLAWTDNQTIRGV
ncbi:hypothetical protein LJK88_38220 [Paenibacillus sp. P26]|nr:hypothetical protein LJK88_38220 [Paenibacillus sp. P26]